MAGRRRRGFTMIELLVVVGVIALIGSMLLPALQAAREQARMNSCRHNVGQLAKGVIVHESTLKYFPSGGWGPQWLGIADRPTDSAQPGGWIFNVLPYIEEKNLRDVLVGATVATAAAAYAKLVTTQIPLFACPSRRKADMMYIPTALRTMRGVGDMTVALSTATRSDYAMNSGGSGPCLPMASVKGAFKGLTASSYNSKKVTLCHNGKTQSIGLPAVTSAGHEDDTLGACESCSQPFDSSNMREFTALSSGAASGDSWRKLGQADKIVLDPLDMGIPDMQDGMIARMSRIKEINIVDGLSKTYLLGEKYVTAGTYDVGDDDGDSRPMMVGYSEDNVRWAIDPPRRDTRRDSRPTIFGSPHLGGWNVAYADGAVRTVEFDIDPTVHGQLSTRDGGSRGEPAGTPPN